MTSGTYSWTNPNGNANFPYVNTDGDSNFNWTDNDFNDNWRWLVLASNSCSSPPRRGFFYSQCLFANRQFACRPHLGALRFLYTFCYLSLYFPMQLVEKSLKDLISSFLFEGTESFFLAQDNLRYKELL